MRHAAGDLGPSGARDLGYGGPSLIGTASAASGAQAPARHTGDVAAAIAAAAAVAVVGQNARVADAAVEAARAADPDTREIMLDAPPPPSRRSAAPAAPQRGPSWLPRLITLVDQGMSSVSNILAVLLVAAVLDEAGFGLFSLGYTVLTLALSLSRAYFGTMVSLASDKRRARVLTRRLHSALLLLSLPLAAVVFGVSVAATGGESWQMLLIVAIATPVVCLQDIIRFGASSSGRQWTALISDGVWVALMALPFVAGWKLSPTAALGLWLGAAIAAWVVAQAMFPQPPAFREAWQQLRIRHPVSESVAASAIIATVGSMWILFVAKFAIGPEATGAMRGAATAMGPINVLMAFTSLGLTPALVRRKRSQDLPFCSVVSIGMGVGTLAWCGLLLALPRWMGVKLFHDSWDGIRHVLPVTTLEYICLSLAAGGILGLKVRHRARQLMTQRIATGLITVLAGTGVAFATQNVRYVAATLAVAALASTAIGWVQLVRSPATQPAEAGTGAGSGSAPGSAPGSGGSGGSGGSDGPSRVGPGGRQPGEATPPQPPPAVPVAAGVGASSRAGLDWFGTSTVTPPTRDVVRSGSAVLEPVGQGSVRAEPVRAEPVRAEPAGVQESIRLWPAPPVPPSTAAAGGSSSVSGSGEFLLPRGFGRPEVPAGRHSGAQAQSTRPAGERWVNTTAPTGAAAVRLNGRAAPPAESPAESVGEASARKQANRHRGAHAAPSPSVADVEPEPASGHQEHPADTGAGPRGRRHAAVAAGGPSGHRGEAGAGSRG